MKSLMSVCIGELRRIFLLRSAFSVLIVGLAVYSVFYPQPYLNEALRNVPIAIVDKDGTVASRQLVQFIDATPDVAVTMAFPDLASAEREIYLRNVYGILVVPQYFERDLLHGRPSPIALYSDASYFLVSQRVTTAVSSVAKAMGTAVETSRLVALGVDSVIAQAAADPMPLTAEPLFNPQAGYATYILPAAFVLILQQTLLIAVGLLGTAPRQQTVAGPVATVLGKLTAYLAIEAILLPLYVIALPYFYGIPRLGAPAAIMFFAIPFVLAVGSLGLVIAGLFRSPLTVQLVTAAVGMPFMFLSGFSWPQEAIPGPVKLAALLLPSTSAIDGLVRLSQLGAALYEVKELLFSLWGLAFLYGGIAIFFEARDQSSEAHELSASKVASRTNAV